MPAIIHPGYWIPYLNEEVFAGLRSELEALEQARRPYFAYLHLWSPHLPYRPRSDYRKMFRDDFEPDAKPAPYLREALSADYLLTLRTLYDRQVAQLDAELGALLSGLEASGALDRTYLIFTSDHGELFERGFYGHGLRHLYEPVLRIPLVVHAPGQATRVDIRTPTSNIDLLPSLLDLAGREVGTGFDGRLLPGLGGVEELERPIFSMNADTNSAFGPITRASIAMRKGGYKMISYLGYSDLDRVFELYDLENDPDELQDLAGKESRILALLKDELFENLDNANRPFVG
jgi:arylsulfatase A-like enzyme